MGAALVVGFASMVFADTDGTVVGGAHFCDYTDEIDGWGCKELIYRYLFVLELIYWA